MSLSILIRLGAGDPAGRGPSNVSMTIIRPPQARAAARRRNVFGLAVGLGARALGSGLRRREQLSGALDGVRSKGAGEEAVMSDAVEAARQHVQEKAADELVGVERHRFEPVAALDPVVLPLEGDGLLVERDEAGVRDRDAVGVAGEIGEDGLRRAAFASSA